MNVPLHSARDDSVTAYTVGASCGKVTLELFESLGGFEDNAAAWFRGFSETIGVDVMPRHEEVIRKTIRDALTRRAKIQAMATAISMTAGKELLYLRELLDDLSKPTPIEGIQEK
jgi:hypothetical protein